MAFSLKRMSSAPDASILARRQAVSKAFSVASRGVFTHGPPGSGVRGVHVQGKVPSPTSNIPVLIMSSSLWSVAEEGTGDQAER
ncbi:hypothetical protein GCM10018952_67450 [Streptosporangium vulgare]